GLAETLRAQNKFSDAETLYRENLKRWPDDPVVRHGLANLLRRYGNPQAWNEALELLPPIGNEIIGQRAHYVAHLRGVILLEQGDVTGAAALFNQGLASRPDPKSEKLYRQSLLLADLKQQRFTEAMQKLASLQDTRDANDKILVLHAFAGHHTPQHPEVIRRYQELTSVKEQFSPAARAAFDCLVHTFRLPANDEPAFTPNPQAHDQLIGLEIEMILNAA
ncbi:MAG: tetratricopeptide repeat protein, partial [Magnetococcales bacterium]|nr:tetratricopeptide repeat protein [Magnetococcales bacterium]